MDFFMKPEELTLDQCPSIVNLLQQLAVTIATKTQAKICDEINNLETFLGDRIDQVESTISQLSNIEGFAEKIRQLTELIAALDTNQDGHFEELTGITSQLSSLANQITALVAANTATNDLAASTERNLIALQTAFSQFAASITASITELTARMDAIESRVSALESRPTADLCALGRDIQSGLSTISDAIDAIFAVSCHK